MIGIVIFSSCSSFLDTEDLTKKNSDNFPKTEEDINTSLLAVYSAMAEDTKPYWNNIFIISETMSDDRFGGGGSVDRMMWAMNEYKKDQDNMYSHLWSKYYKGIFRSNFVLESLDRIDWQDDEKRNKVEGQAYFLRGFIYFDLCRLFGSVPLVLSLIHI